MSEPNDLIAKPDCIALDLSAKSGEEAIRALHGQLGSADGAVIDEPRFLADLLERASLASVCIADAIALPHARTTAVGRLVLAIGRSKQGIAFDAAHPAVRLVFLIGVPKIAVTDYLQLVAALARMLKNSAVRQGLLAASTEEEFLASLARGVKSKR